MPRTKAGTLKPKIDQIRKALREKKAEPTAENRALRGRLKRMQRKARRIHTAEQRLVPRPKAGATASE